MLYLFFQRSYCNLKMKENNKKNNNNNNNNKKKYYKFWQKQYNFPLRGKL